MKIKEKFELADGVTILACSDCGASSGVIGKEFSLVCGGEVRQTFTITGEKKMHNSKSAPDQKAFETTDKVLLSQEEARSGKWYLVVQ